MSMDFLASSKKKKKNPHGLVWFSAQVKKQILDDQLISQFWLCLLAGLPGFL